MTGKTRAQLAQRSDHVRRLCCLVDAGLVPDYCESCGLAMTPNRERRFCRRCYFRIYKRAYRRRAKGASDG